MSERRKCAVRTCGRNVAMEQLVCSLHAASGDVERGVYAEWNTGWEFFPAGHALHDELAAVRGTRAAVRHEGNVTCL